MKLRHWVTGCLTWMMIAAGPGEAQKPPLLPAKDVAALANELSGEAAKRNLEAIATFHRQRGSQGFHSAAELVAERLREYGLSDVRILEFPADGKIFYGTQRSRPAWDAEFAELRQVTTRRSSRRKWAGPFPVGYYDGVAIEQETLASFEKEPVVLAEDSESADVTAELIDVGEGIKESDYTGKDVKGKIVLVSAQPGAVQDLAVGRFGAAGIVSYAQNQKTAWSGENQDAIRWGHLETFSPNKTFAFMVSLKTGRGFQARLAAGEKITLHAIVKAGQHSGNYEVVTATIPGADPKLKAEEIAFSCHLDHQRPGANDNASGCVTILEVARTLAKLTKESRPSRCTPLNLSDADKETLKDFAGLGLCGGLYRPADLQPPARTIRFIFPPEIEGTMALLNSKPEFAKRIKAVIHMDMVGGGPETKAVFHVTRGPMSLPSFVHDVAWSFAEWVNEESYKFAATGIAEYPLAAPEGGKEPLRAEYSAYTMGSDHDVYQDSSFGIPAIYLNDWPDRYIHTNFDTAANIDTTKLKRAAFIGAASGYFLAGFTKMGPSSIWTTPHLSVPAEMQFLRAAEQTRRCREVSDTNCSSIVSAFNSYEHGVHASYGQFVGDSNRVGVEGEDDFLAVSKLHWQVGGNLMPVLPELRFFWKRKESPKGPMTVFGYDYFVDQGKKAGIAMPKLLTYEGLWGAGEEYAYEVLNFADGKRNAEQIRWAVSAEYGPVPLELVVEYLRALEKIGVVEGVRKEL